MADTKIDGRRLGAIKTAAKKAGVSLDEYIAKVAAGLKYCWPCNSWHDKSVFNIDRSRGDGLAAICKAQQSKRSKAAYIPAHPSLKLPRFLTETRDGDKKQARRRINYLVEQGVIPHPDEVPCSDCADGVWANSYRHEYDHARGYDGDNQLYVEPVCSRCHRIREEDRRACTA